MPAPGGASSLEHRALGSSHIGTLSQPTASITVDVPDANIVSLTVLATAADPSAIVYPFDVVSPDGKHLFQFDPADPETLGRALDAAPLQISPHPGLLAIGIYGGPDRPVSPGKYVIRYGATSPAEVTFDAVLKRVDGAVGAGRLPVTFWVPKLTSLTADTAPNDANLDKAISVFRDVYSGAGITLEPEFRALPDSDGADHSVVTSKADLDALPRLADGTDAAGLQIVLVDRVDVVEGDVHFGGLANGIPGAPTYPGLAHGGVVVSLRDLASNPVKIGLTIAHEAGHYLGLHHTSEASGISFDRLGDTPECHLETEDANHDGTLSADECAKVDALNLMFPAQAPWLPTGNLTAEQVAIMLRSPLVVSP